MNCIAYRFPAASNAIRRRTAALLFCVLPLAVVATASTRPKYGGILRVQMRGRIDTLDPRQWPADLLKQGVVGRVAPLIFDRLVKFDDHAVLQPSLAVSWDHDEKFKLWKFVLRKDVKFSDDSALTPEATALALQQLLGNAFEISANSDSVVIQSDHPMPELSRVLAGGRYFIFRVSADGSLVGTGPFRAENRLSAVAQTKLNLVANQLCWAGRPFTDRIEFTMGVSAQEQSAALSLAHADVIEIPPSEVRRAEQRGIRSVSSEPVSLLALRMDISRPSVSDLRVRQAISLAVDRNSIANVILQRRAIVAGGLLPNLLSGYEFLFPATQDLPQARELFKAPGRKVSGTSPLVLVYDFDDGEARHVAERVAVDLKEAGIADQVSIKSSMEKHPPADMNIMRVTINTPDSGIALVALLNALGEPSSDADTLEQMYAQERAPIESYRVIPLVHLTETYGLSPQVRDWMRPRWGGWRLEDVWLETAITSEGTRP